jgi:hypothetical protein
MMTGDLREQVKAQPILAAFIVLWAVEAYMNMLYGYKRAGGGAGALGYAAMFGAIAFIAAWLPTRIAHVQGSDAGAFVKRAVFALLAASCFGLSVMAGCSVLGVATADGSVARNMKATKHSTAADQLAQARADRKALGTQPAPEQVQERIGAELATVTRYGTIAELTENCKEADKAPTACKKVAALKTQLADAKRAVALDTQIEQREAKLGATEAVAEGAPELAILAKLTGFEEKEVGQWWAVALIVILEIFSNFGFALAGMGGPGNPAPVHATAGANWAAAQGSLPAPPSFPMIDHRPREDHPHPQPAYGAPINIHVAAANAQPTPPAGVASPTAMASQPEERQSPASTQPRAETRPLSRAIASPARPAPQQPVDRNPLRELLDSMAVFKASALAAHNGAATAFDQVYAVYRSWAGSAAVEADKFHMAFSAATNAKVGVLAGSPHYMDLSLIASPTVQIQGHA